MEYQLFGDHYIKRENEGHDWEHASDQESAGKEIAEQKIATAILRDTPDPGPVIIRSQQNIDIAAKLGLSAGELADDLARSDHNDGTRIRLSDDEFDLEMAWLGLSSQEAGDRFAGRFWSGS